MSISKDKVLNLLLLLLIILLSTKIIFNNLGMTTIWCWDEARRAENALEILKTGDWIVMHYGGMPDLWNLKGPLPAWLIAISFKIFGLNEFALRFWSALFGVATIAVVYLFGLEIKNRYVGLYAALILLSMQGFIGYHGVRTGDCDVIVTFFLVLSLYLFYVGQRKNHLLFPIFASASMALGILAKELIIIVPVIIGLYLLRFKSFKKTIFSKKTIYVVITFLGISGPWFIARFLRGEDFFIKKIQYDIIKRFSTVLEGHVGSWYYYFIILKKNGPGLVLLSFFFISLIYSCYLVIKKDRPLSLLILWIVPYFVAISLIKTKIFWYIIPIYPAISLLTAYNIGIIGEYFKNKKFIVLLLFLIILIFPLASIVKSTKYSIVSPEAQIIKDIKEELKEIDNLYIQEDENNQAVYFYLNAYIQGIAKTYRDSDEVALKEGDVIITFDIHRLSILSQKDDYRSIIKSRNVGLFSKI